MATEPSPMLYALYALLFLLGALIVYVTLKLRAEQRAKLNLPPEP